MQRDLENMPVHDLCELLVFKTTELLKAFQEKHSDGNQIHYLQAEVQAIHEAIRVKRGESASGRKNEIPNY